MAMAILLAVMYTLLAEPCYAGSETYSNGYYYYTVEDDYVIITGYFGQEKEITVPDSIVGRPVSTIATGAFADSETLTTVHLPDTVMTIENGAFGPNQKVIYDKRNGNNGNKNSENISEGGKDSGNTSNNTSEATSKTSSKAGNQSGQGNTSNSSASGAGNNGSSVSETTESDDEVSISEAESTLDENDGVSGKKGLTDKEESHGARRILGFCLLGIIIASFAAFGIYYIRNKNVRD